jgi:hypothetical protein
MKSIPDLEGEIFINVPLSGFLHEKNKMQIKQAQKPILILRNPRIKIILFI